MGQFWLDKPNQYDGRQARLDRFLSSWRTAMVVYVAIVGIGFPAFLFALLSKPMLFAWLAFTAFIGARTFWLLRRARARERDATNTQQAAYRATRSIMMGSANHVAGHPALGRDQRVLLAVGEDAFRLFAFSSPEPLDQVLATAIQKVELVVYDDERIPHTDAIDAAAQALQLTFARGTTTVRCLFNQMLDYRPIDWYHQLERLRCSSAE
jgi:hypothetical protein